MLEFIPNLLSHKDIEKFVAVSDQYRTKHNYTPLPVELIKIKEAVESLIDINYNQFYWTIECRPRGCEWHYDGCKTDFSPNHMGWCNYSAVMLLTPPENFEGGEYQYVDKDHTKENPNILKDDHYGSLLVYSGAADNDPLLHRATPHTGGERWMFLMFMDGKEKV